MFVPLTAAKELLLPQIAGEVLRELSPYLLPSQDCLALSHNVALLYLVYQPKNPFSTPVDLLERYSLDTLAALCAAYQTWEPSEQEGLCELSAEATAS